ncbi:MAG: hypothetical protein LIO62_04620 [Clostridiales bacterium]|nr:hypothetical protein [Clostridiales bacterium]
MEKSALSIAAKINNKIKAIRIIAVILAAVLLIFPPINLIFRIVGAIIVLILAVFLARKVRLSVLNILTNDCDPELFKYVCHATFPKGSTDFYDALSSLYSGDFDTLAELTAKLVRTNNNPVTKITYLDAFTTGAFIAGDFQMCGDTIEKVIDLIKKTKLKEDLKNTYITKYNFFKSFISCDYKDALDQLENREKLTAEKSNNAQKFIHCYYKGITLYYSGKTSEAKEQFEMITSKNPKLYICKKAYDYLDAIDKGEFTAVGSVSFKESYEKGLLDTDSESQIPNKKDGKKKTFSAVIAVVLIVIAVICFINIPGIKQGSAYDVIADDIEINNILATIKIDDEYSVFIFDTPYDEIGTAYLKYHDNGKYSLCIAQASTSDSYISDDSNYCIYASGKSPRVYFDITNDESSIPENSQATEFTVNGENYYFYIIRTEVKYNYANSYTAY